MNREDIIFLDIGANVGAHTLAVAAHGFQVLAFEPMSINIQCLRHSLCLNPQLRSRITLVPKVGDRDRSLIIVFCVAAGHDPHVALTNSTSNAQGCLAWPNSVRIAPAGSGECH
jgi:FkbM family methyltransferase